MKLSTFKTQIRSLLFVFALCSPWANSFAQDAAKCADDCFNANTAEMKTCFEQMVSISYSDCTPDTTPANGEPSLSDSKSCHTKATQKASGCMKNLRQCMKKCMK